MFDYLANFDDFQNAKKSKKLVFFEFGARWCQTCSLLEGVLEKISDESSDKAAFYRIDAEQMPDAFIAYDIRNIPTVIIYKDSRPVRSLTGFHNEYFFIKIIDELLED